MPPFKGFEGPSFNFSKKAVGVLWEAGHGQKLAIVDASYKVPRKATKVRYGGTSADALRAVVRWIPLDAVRTVDTNVGNGELDVAEILCMAPDPPAETCAALKHFKAVGKEFLGVDIKSVPRLDKHIEEGEGWYSLANNPDTIFLKTVGRLSYACALMDIGHSQLPVSE